MSTDALRDALSECVRVFEAEAGYVSGGFQAIKDARAVLASPTEGAAEPDELQIGQQVWVPGEVEDVYMGGRYSAPEPRVVVKVSRMSSIGFHRDQVRAAQPAPPEGASRESKAVEFAECMAKGAERLLDALNAEDAMRLRREESDDVDEDAIYDRSTSRAKCAADLRSYIYEFRKRAALAIQGAGGQPLVDEAQALPGERCGGPAWETER